MDCPDCFNKYCTYNPCGADTHDSISIPGSYTLNHYQKDANSTAIYQGKGDDEGRGITYTILGLVGESGELANKWKKYLRDIPIPIPNPNNNANSNPNNNDNSSPNPNNNIDTNGLREELGDVLWYVAALASELGISLGGLALMNRNKLRSRQERGVLKGSGDDR